jgi:hypothetical protein
VLLMNWLLAISILLIIIGCAFSILRDPQTIDYCRTIVQDGRKDTYARNVMALYYSGLVTAVVGTLLLIFTTVLIASE